ncbi:hypothetical protein DPMN_031215 [Dreissena polymorpha]|uniref:Mutator-like transposase domain-containing protein n=1 Tax=Dreissena polymorpha TaxID=45954 RepID=A0A9D4RHU3_DREPO|nr:hypothetical protein DPMN_031215 [Dreissena polymorpha]
MFSRGCTEMSRDKKGRFSTRSMSQHDSKYVNLDHGYSSTSDNVPQSVNEPWKIGRRLVEWEVVKAIVGHRLCGVCSWWRRNKPGQKVRPHRCVRNHTGSARAMEATSGVKGVKELSEQGTPVEYLEGDGDNTLISKLKSDLNVTMKKRFDKNHVVKNFTKSLY